MAKYERIYPPSWHDRHDPNCPECGASGKLFYVGMTTELNRGEFKQHKLYQCSTCRRLFQEIL